MERVLIAAAVAGCAALMAALLVPPLIRMTERLGLLSVPSEARQVHIRPLPRIGGVAMFIAFASAIGLSFALPVERFPEEVERIVLLLIGATLIVAVMLYDDLVGASPLVKLAWQAAAAGVVLLPRLRGPDHGIVIEQFNNPFGGTVHLPLVVALGFTLFWIIGMMNTLNFVDGLDGLAASVTLVAATVLFVHTFFRPEGNPQFTISILAVALAAAVIGFLPYNWYPARIIMGDVGAMFLGFTLAIVAIIGGAKIATALLALWLPILDVAWLIVYRLMNGRSPLQADRGHLHHRLLDLGWSQQQVVIFVAGVSGLLGVIALAATSPEIKLAALVVVGVAGLCGLALLARRCDRLQDQSVSEA